MVTTRIRVPALLLVLAAAAASMSGPAQAREATRHSDDEVRRVGPCSGRASWEMRAKEDDDGRIEVRGRVDSVRGGETWAWKVKHNGSVSAAGRAATSGSSAAFEVRRVIVDLPGVDHGVFRAVRQRTGEVCRGVIDW